jgi:dipeptidyl aminopeptidase/acylaminoacyl peptidase
MTRYTGLVRLVPLVAAAVGVGCLVAGCEVRQVPAEGTPSARRLPAPPPRPYLAFVNVASDDAFKHVSLAPLSGLNHELFLTPLTCERVSFSGTTGICLTVPDDGAVTLSDKPTIWVDVFNDQFEKVHRFTLQGSPSRARVSADGRRAVVTVFDSGHSYAMTGFSTITTIFDLERRETIGDLESFSISRDSRPFKAEDFNFWGVTFARDSDTFFATLKTGDKHYLIKGSVNARSGHVVHTGVECPSLSPDGRRIAFKRRVGSDSRGWWQIVVLDLSTMAERPLWNEQRSVDDQVEWLDDRRILYNMTGGNTAADVWVMDVDSQEAAYPLLHSAYSPATVR